MAVKKELQKIENLKIDNVEIGSAKVEYDENQIDNQKIIEAIEEAGYKVVSN